MSHHEPQFGHGTATVTKTGGRPRHASRHLLDLKPLTPPPAPRPKPVRQMAWRRLLDQRIHLQEVHRRTLTLHPKGWRDFPPTHAKTMGHALAITVRRFFREHPLADLTLLTLVHLSVVVCWHALLAPPRLVLRLFRRVDRTEALPLIPFISLAVAPEEEESYDDGLEMLDAPSEPEPYRPAPSFFGLGFSALGLAAAALVFALPFGAYSTLATIRDSKIDVVSRSTEAMYMLRAAGQALQSVDFQTASDALVGAQELFADARTRLGFSGRLLTAAAARLPFFKGPIASASPALSAGQEFAAGGAELVSGMKEAGDAEDPIDAIGRLRARLTRALPHLASAEKSLLAVRPDAVPADYRPLLAEAQDRIPSLAAYLEKADTLSAALPAILGAEMKQRYLVIFQNDAELRATGGFMGSFALVDVDRGKVVNVEIPGGGTYDLKGQLQLKLASPQPLHLINPHWQFQDTNWSPDFPSAAVTMTKFYGKAGGPSVDGVIALNTPVVEKLLEIIGPVEMPEYGKTIDSRNFFFETQKAVEIEYDKESNTPKKFIADLAPKILTKIMTAERGEWLKIARMLDESLTARQAQAWFRDAGSESAMRKLGWDGALTGPAAGGDFLAVVHTNIAGQKTDRVIADEISHEAKVLPDGSAIVTLTVTRRHDGVPGSLFTGVRNVDWLRVYVPKGSVLIEASGFDQPDAKLFKIPEPEYVSDPEIASPENDLSVDRSSGTVTSEELGLTVFGNWIQTDPGRSSTVTLVYQLPPGTVAVSVPATDGLEGLVNRVMRENRAIRYALTVRKQAGADRTTFTTSLDLPRGYALLPATRRAEDDRGRWSVTLPLDRDTALDDTMEMP